MAPAARAGGMTTDPRDANEEALLKAYLASRAEEDFDAMVLGIGSRVKALIVSKLAKSLRHMMDELFTDTMLAVRDGANSFRGESTALAWIDGIVRNMVFQAIRND